jgi:hypothetical protein
MITIVNLPENMYGVVDLSNVDNRERFIANRLTTFIGRSDKDSEPTLYLVAHSCVVDLNDPHNTFSDYCKLIVERWVDVSITIQPE